MTTSEAAQLLRVSESTLKRWADEGVICSHRTSGGHRRFQRSDVDALAAALVSATDAPDRWADVLLLTEEPLRLHARVFDARVRLGSWWRLADRFAEAIADLEDRRARGDISAIALRDALERLSRVLALSLAHAPRPADAPTALLAHLPGERGRALLATLELCLAEAGWRSRWAGPASCADLAAEVARTPPDALIVAAGATSAGLAEPFARDLARALEPARPVAFVGLDASVVVDGVAALGALSDVQAWLRGSGAAPHGAAA